MATDRDAGLAANRFERSDVGTRPLTIFFLVIAALLVFSAFAMKWLFDLYASGQMQTNGQPSPFENVRPLPAPPRLQDEPMQDISSYLRSQQDQLNHYAWVDRPNGIVRVPIDRAMQMLIEKGLPARPPSATRQVTPNPSGSAGGTDLGESQP